MFITDLDGNETKWSLDTVEKSVKSNLHLEAKKIIREVFPTALLLEEVKIPIKRNKQLYLDFYLLIFKIAIEIQGEQHFNYSNFFNKNPINFAFQKINDLNKKRWCDLNEITLIKFNYNEQSDWKSKLLECGFNNKHE